MHLNTSARSFNYQTAARTYCCISTWILILPEGGGAVVAPGATVGVAGHCGVELAGQLPHVQGHFFLTLLQVLVFAESEHPEQAPHVF